MAEYIDKQALIEGMVKVDGRKWSTKTLGGVQFPRPAGNRGWFLLMGRTERR